MAAKHPCRRAIKIFLISFTIILTSAMGCFAAEPVNSNICTACSAFNALNSRIRDGVIYKGAAEELVAELIPKIRDYYFKNGGIKYGKDSWVFPVEGYSAAMPDIAYKRDYRPQGYNYYDGNNHGGHPSYDIFIRDKNQDELDDATGRPVNILSMTGGIVVAMESEWQPGSSLRGGKYIWIYDPSAEALIYYAHNRDVFVRGGDIVKPGDKIAAMGRTGINAYKKRSPTHLHITYLKVHPDGGLIPVDIYEHLKKAKKMGAKNAAK